jgi:hypothetical protein
MERSWGRTGLGSASRNRTLVERFHGYCSGYGSTADDPYVNPEYEAIRLPYGRAVVPEGNESTTTVEGPQTASTPAQEKENKSVVSNPGKAAGGGRGVASEKRLASDEKETKKVRTVAVATTLTGCSGFPPDGGAVLQYSVMKHQKLKSMPSRYQYHFYAIYHPSAKECALPLADLNYTLLERDSPVLPQDIRNGSELRDRIAGSGTLCPSSDSLGFERISVQMLTVFNFCLQLLPK